MMNLTDVMELTKLLGQVSVTAMALRTSPNAVTLAASAKALSDLSAFVSTRGPEAAELLKKMTSKVLSKPVADVSTTGTISDLAAAEEIISTVQDQEAAAQNYSGNVKTEGLNPKALEAIKAALSKAQDALKAKTAVSAQNEKAERLAAQLSLMADMTERGIPTTFFDKDAYILRDVAEMLRNPPQSSLKDVAVKTAKDLDLEAVGSKVAGVWRGLRKG